MSEAKPTFNKTRVALAAAFVYFLSFKAVNTENASVWLLLSGYTLMVLSSVTSVIIMVNLLREQLGYHKQKKNLD